ncbi:hypothetical protein KIN20_020234, partial [Parelaphostrongylus tenuis]
NYCSRYSSDNTWTKTATDQIQRIMNSTGGPQTCSYVRKVALKDGKMDAQEMFEGSEPTAAAVEHQ